MLSVINLLFHGIFIAVICVITLILRRTIGRERDNLIRKTRIMKENEFVDRASLQDKILLKMMENTTKRPPTSSRIILTVK
ncbi:hypothetical protein Y032_0197g1571 [Ancylostoma ceylanicum]|uniref:Uncharacterized protein n=1 Tax=Ancylostoma ceylanicum TaxID=53326 RepID=A0A016SPB9_9BILA|nr:hypothetical protein Y032_0197g1571 [Ancylostoma ceylanicum]